MSEPGLNAAKADGSGEGLPEPTSPVAADGESAGETPPRRSMSGLWWEVAVVLAVGVIPNLVSAVSHLCQPMPPAPYWLATFELSVLSACTILVVLYVVGRSGEGWERFGLGRPRWWDWPVGFALALVGEAIWSFVAAVPWPEWGPGGSAFSRPQGLADRVMMVPKFGLAALAEEVVRAYLIVRLAVLFRSRGEAVVTAAVLFASYHAYQGLPGVADALIFGLVYGGIFLAVRRVWPLALGHALYNMRVELLVG
jgi:membrane protease YdiL (CAAX protease family)